MKRADARKIAETVTREQLAVMFERAKLEVRDWKKASPVNPSVSLGKAWNLFYPFFMSGQRLIIIHKKNMVWAFGDYLDESLKPVKAKPASLPIPFHEEPVFEVSP